MDVGSDFLHAFTCFITFFFVFNLTIPTELKNTFNFIESYVLKLNEKDPFPEEYQELLLQSNEYTNLRKK